MMARPGARTAALLVGALMLTTGCLGVLDVEGIPTEPALAPASSDDPSTQPAVPLDADPPERATVVLELALTDESAPPLDVEAVDVDVGSPSSVSVQTTTGRLLAGKSARIAYLHVLPGTDVPGASIDITLFDGLGQATLSLAVDGFHAGDDLAQAVVLRSQAPGQIGIVETEGPLEVTASTPNAVPQYGYMLWPDGNREPLPGFEHVIQVPEGFPNIPAGEQVELVAEVPDDEDVLWRLGSDETVEGHKVSFEAEPGVQPVHVSVGPGESSADLSVHTDFDRTVNGTLVAATPGDTMVQPVNAAEHPFEVEEGALWLKLMLRLEHGEIPGRDLTVSLVDDDGDTVATSTAEDGDVDVLTIDAPIQPGGYAAKIEAESGAATPYNLSIHVDY